MEKKLLLFDLDGTLLNSEKKISKRTMEVLQTCRQNGILIGVSTSRCEQNSLKYISELNPDILIASGGAVVKRGSEYIYTAEMSVEETQSMIATTRKILGEDCEISVDTIDTNYWNYKVDPRIADQNWGDSVYSDFVDFPEPALKFCAEIFEDEKAMELKEAFPNCDCARFSDGYWYKFTKAGVTKESAIQFMCASCGIALENVIAFGDDYADIGMLKLCGVGVAMGNAIDEVKAIADVVIGTNDEDGIAEYLEKWA